MATTAKGKGGGYPLRTYPLREPNFNGEYIHTSFMNFLSSLQNNIEVSEQLPTTERIRLTMMNVVHTKLIQEEELILNQIKSVDPRYYRYLTGVEKIKDESIVKTYETMFNEVVQELDLKNLEKRARNRQNLKGNLLTDRNTRMISQAFSSAFERAREELGEVDEGTATRLKTLNTQLKRFRTQFNRGAIQARKATRANSLELQQEVLNNFKTQMFGALQEFLDGSVFEVADEFIKDYSADSAKRNYSRSVKIPAPNASAANPIAFDTTKKAFDYEHIKRRMQQKIVQSGELKKRLFEDEGVQFIMGNAARFKVITTDSDKYIGQVMTEIFADMSKPLIRDYQRSQKRRLFVLKDGKIVRRSEIVKQSIEKMRFDLNFSMDYGSRQSRSFKQFDKDKARRVARHESSDESFYRKRLPVSKKKFRSLSAGFAYTVSLT